MLSKISFVVLVCASLSTSAQDSLVYFNEIKFSGDIEKQAFVDYFKSNKRDYFTLFNQPGKKSSAEARQRFYRYLDDFGYEKIAGKKDDKKVKFIYESIHKAFLSKYEANTLFTDIFFGGEYNCVSATALYSMAFEYFKIPFSIKEKPTHVYPVAYPASQQVIVETTNPTVGSFAFDQRFKVGYLERLKEQKLISVAEFAQNDINKLFDKYFFQEQQDIGLHELIGIQYMNDGIFKIEENEFLAASEQMEKAYLFYPTDRIANGLLVAYFKAFQSITTKNTQHAKLLAKISRFKKNGITEEMVKGDFNNAIQDLLFERGKTDAAQEYGNTLLHGIKDPDLKRELDFIFQYEFGRYYYNKGSYVVARPFFEKALSCKPNHQETQRIYITLLERALKTSDSDAAFLKIIEDAIKNYPELESNNIFNAVVATAYLYGFYMSYSDNNAIEGERFKSLFEKQRARFTDIEVESNAIGQAYSTAAVYYFKRGQSAKAKAYIKKGLEYAPANRELQMRQQMIN